MKTLKLIIPIILFSLAFTACSDDDHVRIDSLSADGNEFYCNQKVKLWMCVESSDLWNTDYYWECEGGRLTQPQGLDEMTWQAPSVPGEYIVRCTVTTGGKKETREHTLYVSSYFFEKFEKSGHAFTIQGSTTSSIKTESNGNKYLETSVNSASEVTRYIRRTFGDEELCTPFSTAMKIGYVSNMPTDSIIVGSNNSANTLEFRWNCQSHTSLEGKGYISQVRLVWFPTVCESGYPVNENTVEATAENPDKQYNVWIRIRYTNEAGANVFLDEYRYLNTLNNFENGIYRNISLSVDENFNILVYNEGELALTSGLLQQSRQTHGWSSQIYINQWDIYYTNGNGARNIPVMYFDDAYASMTEILK